MAQRANLNDVSLYLITDDKRSLGRSAAEVVGAAVAAGLKLAQYRPWQTGDSDCIKHGKLLRKITGDAGCLLLINSRPKIAAEIGADGVHLGEKSISIESTRKIIGDNAIIGYSAHSIESGLDAAERGADFVTFSPIFPTTSTSDIREALGIEKLNELISMSRIPVFPLGGIGLPQIISLKSNGIKRAAVISAITEREDIAAVVKEILAALE